jgi:hypothetical protein
LVVLKLGVAEEEIAATKIKLNAMRENRFFFTAGFSGKIGNTRTMPYRLALIHAGDARLK